MELSDQDIAETNDGLTARMQDPEERAHWLDVCRSYRQHALFGEAQWNGHKARISALDSSQQELLPPRSVPGTPEFKERKEKYSQSLIKNQFALDCILRHAGQPHSQQHNDGAFGGSEKASKVVSVLKSLVRDWSAEAKPEREPYLRLIQQLQQYVPVGSQSHQRPRVCVPGAGLGRLACEICSRGYHTQGNEFSLYMLLASDFILNSGIAQGSLPIAPYIFESRNNHEIGDAFRSLRIPDIRPLQLLQADANSDISGSAKFSMTAGDFNTIYIGDEHRGRWDAVVSYFFLDATPNIVQTLQTVHGMLRSGGCLLNFGPLLWHWSGPPVRPDETMASYMDRNAHLDENYLKSIDLSLEEVREVLLKLGFRIIHEESNLRSTYTADTRSMMYTSYNCINFVAIKC